MLQKKAVSLHQLQRNIELELWRKIAFLGRRVFLHQLAEIYITNQKEQPISSSIQKSFR